ncbi:FAS1-like dehydratase domain-containing protein [Phenylobacterium sp.]|uniref:FAS1-like dehydratase domain-containing protein n=1 Tax=Phenylobacterium sp. TaxID=1871053 RepID=UPI002F428D6F
MASAIAAAPDLVSEAMRGAIGRVLRTRTSYPISASDIRKWAIAVYFPEPPPAEFMDAGAAGGERPLAAPHEFNPFAWASPGAEPRRAEISAGFLEREAGVEPPDVKFMVNGGMVCEYGVRMTEGDVIGTQFSIRGYAQKQGKRGPLLLTETQDRWTNQRGELVRSTVMTLVRY